MKTISVALGAYFEDFIKTKVAQGRSNNASEVIRTGLRLLEENESRVMELKAAIAKGFENGEEAVDFDSQEHLKALNATLCNFPDFICSSSNCSIFSRMTLCLFSRVIN